MALTITVTKVETAPGGWRRETKERVPLVPPKKWSCFTPAANRSLTKKAETCLRKVEKMLDENKATEANVRRALVAFLTGWHRMGYSKSFRDSGCSDSDVREVVGGFHDAIWDAVFGWGAYEEWERNNDKASLKVMRENGYGR